MKPETKKYLHKRKQIIDIIQNTECYMQDSSDEMCMAQIKIYIDFWAARKMAEKILSKVGISKPNEIKEQESSGYAIG